MAEEEKKTQKIPQRRKRAHAGVASFIALTVVIIAIFTGGIAYGVQSLIGGEEVVEGVLVDGVREFRISAQQWYYEPAMIRVNPGDTVRFTVTSQDITHGFAINELGFNLPLSLGVAAKHEVVIPLDMAEGTYTMYCSIFCGVGHPYMKGNVIIGERGTDMRKVLPYVATSVLASMFAVFIVRERRRAK